MRKDSRASRPASKRIFMGGLVVALAAFFSLPTAAFAVGETTAATDGLDPATITVTALDVTNQVTISDTNGFITIRDSQAGVAEGGGCSFNPLDDEEIRCPVPTDVTGNLVVEVIVNLGAGNDVLFIFADERIVANGGDGNDNLQGSALDDETDVLNGDAGNDTLNGREGGDELNGGADIDHATYSGRGAPVTVTADGVAADDGEALEGDNVANDVEIITGTTFPDSLTGGSGNNTLNGGSEDDVLHGGAGDDTLVGGLGGDDLFGDGGIDTVSYNPESRNVIATAGIGVDDDGADLDPDPLVHQSEGDTIDADVENLTGGSGNDFLTGGDGPGTVSGGSGNDVLNGGATDADDVINGGSGLDTVSYEGKAVPVVVSLDGLPGDGEATEDDNVGADVERATGGSAGDILTGNASVNILNGGGGADTLNGGANNDTLIGGAGADVFNGGSGIDLADYSAEAGGVTVTINNAADDPGGDNVKTDVENVTGGAGVDTITGSTLGNRLTGGGGGDTLNGGDGNDVLVGGDGDDFLFGQGGSDTFDGGLGADLMNGGLGGGDTTSYAGRPGAVDVNLNVAGGDGQIDVDPVTAGDQGENDNIHVSVERITGTSFNDFLRAEFLTGVASNANILNGGNGNDFVNGGDGNDTVNGGGGNDTVIGGYGQDSLSGAGGSDIMKAADAGNSAAGHPGPYKDNISCGSGVDDFSNRDAIDVVAASCP